MLQERLELEGLLRDKNIHFAIRRKAKGFSSIEIKFLKSVDEPTGDPDLYCEDCGTKMRSYRKTDEFPFERTGVVVRFHNVLTYVCGKCGLESSPEDPSQRIVIGESLQLITRRLDAANISMRCPSVRSIRSALG